MNACMARDIDTWEDEGGATCKTLLPSAASLLGSVSQIEWAERIKRYVNAEFDRVAASFRSIAGKQANGKRAETEVEPISMPIAPRSSPRFRSASMVIADGSS